MVKLVDTPASGVGDASRGGSSPLLGTKYESPVTQVTGLFVLGDLRISPLTSAESYPSLFLLRVHQSTCLDNVFFALVEALKINHHKTRELSLTRYPLLSQFLHASPFLLQCGIQRHLHRQQHVHAGDAMLRAQAPRNTQKIHDEY